MYVPFLCMKKRYHFQIRQYIPHGVQYTMHLTIHRLLRELRDKYLKAGGNFELPTETRKKMGVTKLSKLSMGHLDAIQSVLTEGLKNYW